MKFSEKETLVKETGMNVEDTAAWFKKYQVHRDSAGGRGLGSELSFKDYLNKAKIAGLSNPSEIGRGLGQFVLGRIGDVGGYTNDSCRFIPQDQNHREASENGRFDEMARKKSEQMTGQTIETSELVRKAAEARRGQTKETHAGVRATSEALAKKFVLIDPNGVEHRGSNVKEFCVSQGLNVFPIYDVFAGRRQHHKGWTGYYVD